MGLHKIGHDLAAAAAEKIFEEIMDQMFPNVLKDIDFQIQKVQ